MKTPNILVILLLLFSVTLITYCWSSSKSNKTIIINASDIVKESIGVNGMTCIGCEATGLGRSETLEICMVARYGFRFNHDLLHYF